MAHAEGAESTPIVVKPVHAAREKDIGTSVLLYLESERKTRDDVDANLVGNDFTENQYEGFCFTWNGICGSAAFHNSRVKTSQLM